MSYPSVKTIAPGTQLAPGIYAGNFNPNDWAGMPMLVRLLAGSIFIQTGVVDVDCNETCVVGLWQKDCGADCDTSSWVQAVGPVGPAGPSGAPGVNGVQGPQGLQGLQGVAGAPGADGVDALPLPLAGDGGSSGVANLGDTLTFAGAGAAGVTVAGSVVTVTATDDQTAAEVAVTGLVGNLAGENNVANALDAIDNWSKRVINPGAALPIAAVAAAGVQPLLSGGGLLFAETDSIVPAVGADGVVRLEEREFYGLVVGSGSSQSVPFASFVKKNYTDLAALSNVAWDAGDSSFTVLVAGLYDVCAQIIYNPNLDWSGHGAPGTTSGALSLYVFVNGAIRQLVARNELAVAGNTNADYIAVMGCAPVYLNAGDVLDIRAYSTFGGSHATLAYDSVHSMFSVVREG